MLNTQTTPTTNSNTTPNNGKITVSYPNVILDDNNKITTSYLDNGKITVSQTTLPTHELINLKDTLGNLTTAFDDIATVVSMLLNDNLSNHKQHALLRLLQSHAFDYMELCESETDGLKERLGGAK